MSYSFERHTDDESLELYAFGRLGDARAELLEEHLLICEGCRTRLDTTQRYINAMARGSRMLQRESAPSRFSQVAAWLASFRIPAPAWGAAAVAVCGVLFVSTANLRHGSPVLPPVAVSLVAERGTAQTVPASHPLLLQLDVRGLNLAPAVRMTLVDASGSILEEHTAPSVQAVKFQTANPLKPGAYFVRILKPGSSEPAREFALDVR